MFHLTSQTHGQTGEKLAFFSFVFNCVTHFFKQPFSPGAKL